MISLLWEERGKGRCGLGGDGQGKMGCHGIWACVSRGSSFLTLSSLTAKHGTLPQASRPAPAPFFRESTFALCLRQQRFPLLCLIFLLLPAAWPGKAGSHMHLLLDIGGWFLRQLLAQGLAFADAPRKLSLLGSAPRHLPTAPGLSRGSAATLRCQLSCFLGCFYYLCSHSSIIQRSLSFSEQLSQEAAARLAWATSTPGFAGCYF